MQQGDGYDGNEQENKRSRSLRAHFPFMVNLAGRRIGPNDAEDVATAALLDAYNPDRPKPSWDNAREVKNYLRSLVKYRVLEYLKRHKKWRNDFTYIEDYEQFPRSHSSGQSPELAFDCILMRRELDKLSKFDKELVLGYHVVGLTARELAELHQKKESTIRSRIKRATKRLEDFFGPSSDKSISLGVILAWSPTLQSRLSKVIQSVTNLLRRVYFAASTSKAVLFIAAVTTTALVLGDNVPAIPAQTTNGEQTSTALEPHAKDALPPITVPDPAKPPEMQPPSNEIVTTILRTSPLHPVVTDLPIAPRPKLSTTGTKLAARAADQPQANWRNGMTCNDAYGIADAMHRDKAFSSCLELLADARLNRCVDTDWISLQATCQRAAKAPGKAYP